MRYSRAFCTVASFVLVLISTAIAQQAPTTTVPNLIRYGGALKDAQGAPLASRTAGVTFAVYTQQDGGAPLWMETQNVATDSGGNYSVLLGSATAAGLPPDLFSQQEQHWLGVQVQGQPEQPRVLMVSVPYAFKASEADKLAGHSASEFVTADSLQTAVKEQLQAQTTVVTSSGSQPLTSSPYIDNGTMLQTQANFNIDGTGSAALFNATSQYNLGGAAILGTNGTQSLFLGIGAGSSNTGGPNLFLGNLAGHSNTTADYNAFIGANAGYKNTTGAQNLMLGANAGYSNTTGGYNMFIGSLSGYNNTTGSLNTFVGRATGYLNTSGSGGSFLGINAGRASTGNDNTFLGEYSGTATTSGNQNTFVGGYSGQYNLTGSNNLFVGYNAGSAAATASSNNIYLASPGAGSDSGAIRIGAAQTSAYMAGIFGSTTNSGSAVFVDSTGKLGTGGGSGLVTSFNGRSGAVVPASGDYSFSLLSGTLASAQFSGGYNNAVTLSNTSNLFAGSFSGTFTGGGSGLTGIQFGQLSGIVGSTQLNGLYSAALSFSNVHNTFTGNGAGLTGIQFSQLVGQLANAQFSGTYSNAVTLSNSSNAFTGSFTGNGSGLTGVLPSAGSPFYVQNGTTLQTGTSFNIDGSGTTGGTLSGNAVNTVTNYQLGGSALLGADSSSLNLALGFNTGATSSGSQNTFLGINAGQAITSGNTNVFVGIGAGGADTAGSGNTFLGANAGASNTGSGNIFIGSSVGNSTGGSNIYLGVSGPSSESSTIRIGGSSMAAAYIGGIYGASPSGAMPVVVNSNGQLGTATSVGVTSWNGRTGAVVPLTGDYSFPMISGTLSSGQIPPGSPSYIQNSASQQTGASFNIDGGGTVGGTLSGGVVDSASNYTLSGTPVLSATPSNLFVGESAGQSNPSGSANTFVGSNAGQSTTGGASNTFVGDIAGASNTGGNNNTFLGYSTGNQNLSNSNDTFVGYAAGSQSTADNNTFVGYQAGFQTGAGANNLFVGWKAGYNNMTGSGNTYITSQGPASGTESNTIRIGAGTETAAYMAGVYTSSVDNNGVPVFVDDTGLLGTVVSSRRFKEQIQDMGDSSGPLMKLRPVTFLYKSEYSRGERTLQFGLIAEEVAQVYPELVAYDKDGQPYTVRYQYLAPMLLNEVQKQYRREEAQSGIVAAQQEQIAEQQEQIKDQQQEIETLKRQLQVQTASVQERLSRLEGLLREQVQTVAEAKH